MGWGLPAGKKSPWGGDTSGTFPPYFQMETGISSDGVADAFRTPPRYIFYYRFEPNEKSTSSNAPAYGLLDVADNPQDASNPNNGFANELNFQLLAVQRTPDLKYRWKREDYLLVSPGPDRMYGYLKENSDPPVSATLIDGSNCDDITNTK